MHTRLYFAIKILQVRADDRLAHGWYHSKDTLILFQRKRQLIEVGFEFVLLQQHHARALGHVDAHALQKLGLADELQNLAVKVDE